MSAMRSTGIRMKSDRRALGKQQPARTPDPAWEKLGVRAVTTNMVDLQLSGEFRKY